MFASASSDQVCFPRCRIAVPSSQGCQNRVSFSSSKFDEHLFEPLFTFTKPRRRCHEIVTLAFSKSDSSFLVAIWPKRNEIRSANGEPPLRDHNGQLAANG